MDFQTECLKAHNEFRQKHNVPPLTLSKKLCETSQKWADILIRKSQLAHSNNKDFGENIFCMSSSDPNFNVNGRKPAEHWYSEIDKHVFGQASSDISTGHFSQVIWKSSEELGVGYAKLGGRVIVVANYYPPGNVIGRYAENVPPVADFCNNNNGNFNGCNTTNECQNKDVAKGTEGNFKEDFLNAHNEYRRKHGVPPLSLDEALCRFSQEWADHLAAVNKLEHRDECSYGENVYCVISNDPTFTVTGNKAVDTWYAEVEKHPFGREPSSLQSGHFSQVVWMNSKLLGVGVAKNAKDKKIYIVGNYSPSGNYVGQYTENVPPVGGFSNNNNNQNQENFSSADKNVTKGTEGNFKKDFLNAHNQYRMRHGVAPLKLDEALCQYSQEWAEHLASTNQLQHRANCSYGENIFCLSSSDPNFTIKGNKPVDNWYEEVNKHHFGREPNDLGTGHFTQIVWKDSEFLGVGIAKNCGNRKIYVVANYSPAGNYVGQFVENVPPILSSYSNVDNLTSQCQNMSMSDAYQSKDQFENDALNAHNEYRAKHGVPPLKLNKKLCDAAKKWAEHCAKTGVLGHSSNSEYGENVFYAYSSDPNATPSARDAIKSWYDEVKSYVYGKDARSSLHFTQVVWKGSEELGVGLAKDNRGKTFIVANYYPRGNMIGSFAENVPRPI